MSDSSCEIGTEANEGNEGDVFLDGSAQIHRKYVGILKIYIKQEAKSLVFLRSLCLLLLKTELFSRILPDPIAFIPVNHLFFC